MDLGFLTNIGHSLLGEGCPDNIPGQVLHGLFLAGLNPLATIHVKPGLPPAHHLIDQIFRDLLSGKEQLISCIGIPLTNWYGSNPKVHGLIPNNLNTRPAIFVSKTIAMLVFKNYNKWTFSEKREKYQKKRGDYLMAREKKKKPVAKPPTSVTMMQGCETRWSWETPPALIPESAITETFTSDIVVVGAGLGGMPAAMKAAEMGATVHVLEKSHTFGEPRSGFAALTSKVSRALGIKLDRDAVIADMMAVSTCINVQQAHIATYVDNSGEFADWLIDIEAAAGIETRLQHKEIIKMGYWHWYPVHHVFGSSFAANPKVNWMAPMYQYAKDKGAVFHFNNPGKRLIRGENGRVTGVIARKENGDYVKYNANKAVILATGDFGRDPEMVSRYYPSGNQTFWNFCYEKNTGDGHKMGMWVGGVMDSTAGGSIFHGQTITGKDNKGWPYIPAVAQMPMLYVDIAGNRCMNEDLGIFNTPVAILQQPGAYVWSVWDSAWKSKVPVVPAFAMGSNTDERLALDVAEGITLKANTIDELIAKMPVPASNFKATLKRYNELCASGKDTDFLKGAAWMTTVDTPPFYAAGIGTAFCSTFGGLKTGRDAHVLDKDGLPIPGLYAAGNTASFFGPIYICNFGPSAATSSMVFGYLAAKNAVTTGG